MIDGWCKGYDTIVVGPYIFSLYMNPGHHMNFERKYVK